MNLQSRTARILLSAAALSLAPLVQAEVITTFANGDDWTMHRTDATAENRILVKNSSNNPNDRIGVAQFSGYSLSPVTIASVRFDIERTAASNNFNAGETIQLWGVVDGGTDEDIVQADAYSTVSFVSDADATNNLVNDSALTFLGQITFGSDTSGDVLDFAGPAVTAFVQADTNNLMTFLLVAVGNTVDSDTVLIYNENSTVVATEFYPSVLTNGDAVVPEPGSLALLGLGTLLIARRRRS